MNMVDFYIKTKTDELLATKQDKLPTYSASDAGKVLSIDSDGNLVWVTPQ